MDKIIQSIINDNCDHHKIPQNILDELYANLREEQHANVIFELNQYRKELLASGRLSSWYVSRIRCCEIVLIHIITSQNLLHRFYKDDMTKLFDIIESIPNK